MAYRRDRARFAGFALLGGALAAATWGCAVRSPHDVQSDNPLGPSFWLIPVPSDDDSLLGRTFTQPPDTARTLEEQSRPNFCVEKLAPVREAEMPNHYENAINTSSQVGGAALLRLYGFSMDASVATHLIYKVNTTRRVARLDTTEYMECCRQSDCGWGYVSALIYGEGDYSSGKEARAQAGGNFTVISAGSQRSFQVLNTRRIKGYLAAVITAHDRSQGAQACPPGQRWAGMACVDSWMIQLAERTCQHGSSDAHDSTWRDNPELQQQAREEQQQACEWLRLHQLPLPPGAETKTRPSGWQ